MVSYARMAGTIKFAKFASYIMKEVNNMILKGYYTNSGYMGFVDGKYLLFASEQDYEEFVS